ncbi:hypothetical protein [Vallitalea guaymasensis]|uniref:hypothetical protein n=1 Tax=Vallitalea guaymasensis TaxID=1185412 RepID=UPI000DE4C79C|nr:hypothetical protein [Vallitalea guaymasensis]
MFFEDFTRNNNESSLQKSIYHMLYMLASFKEVEVSFNDNIDTKNYLEGEAEFYQYVKNLYFDMYHNNEKYKVDSTKYDEYMKSDKRSKGKFMVEKQHHQDAKESSLRNKFQQSVTFYFRFLYELGIYADICTDTFSLKISKNKYENVLKNAETAKVRGEIHERADILLSSGIDRQEYEDGYVFSCTKYPKMFLGLAVLCRAPESKYKWMNYMRLDYKRYHSPAPEMSDIKETMPQDSAHNINILTETLKGMPLKMRVKPMRNITSDFKWKVEFIYKSKSCIGFYVDYTSLLVCIYFNDSKNITAMADTLRNMDEELFEWYRNHIPERLCKCPNNRWVTLGDTRRRICGMSNRLDVNNPNESDMENCVKVLRTFRKL